jgi:antitoxin CptB
LRWRARRGLLENDLVLTRFLDRHEETLSDDEVLGLHELLDIGDNQLMDLILGRTQPEPGQASPQAMRVLQMLREA